VSGAFCQLVGNSPLDALVPHCNHPVIMSETADPFSLTPEASMTGGAPTRHIPVSIPRSQAGSFMKSRVKHRFLLPALFAGLGLIPVGRATEPTFTNLHSFTAVNFRGVNSDGANPFAGLILSGDTLYGTASEGGTNGEGTVFAINPTGPSFTNLYSFTGSSDGANPGAGLMLSSNTLYGTAEHGGSSGNGTVFAVNITGSGFTNLHNFNFNNASNGAVPVAGYRAAYCMGRRAVAAARATAQCLR